MSFFLIIWYEIFSDYSVENNTKLYFTITPFNHPPFHNCSKINLYISYHKMVHMRYCMAQIHELNWFNHSFIILSQFLTMTKKAKFRSINRSRKWKHWHIKSESKTSILLLYCEFYSYYQLIPLSIILCFLGISRVETKLLQYISGTLTYQYLSGTPWDCSLLASHPAEPHPTDQSSLDSRSDL